MPILSREPKSKFIPVDTGVKGETGNTMTEKGHKSGVKHQGTKAGAKGVKHHTPKHNVEQPPAEWDDGPYVDSRRVVNVNFKKHHNQ